MPRGYFANDETRAERVRDLFDTIAPRYDFINDLQSLWLHRRWKKRLVTLANPRLGQRVLDLCCGTGDIALAMARHGAEIIALDFSQPMLNRARTRDTKGEVNFIQGNALNTGLPDDQFDCTTIAFGLRNLASFEDGLREMHRLTKPGGKMLVLDFGKPTFAPWRWIYFRYLKWIVPIFGKIICRDAPAYAYIHESLEHYPAQEGVEKEMHKLGCSEVTTHPILGSAMTINVGMK